MVESSNSGLMDLVKKAKASSYELASIGSKLKNSVLNEVAVNLEKNAEYILSRNKLDVNRASEKALTSAFVERLTLTKDRIFSMANGIRKVAALEDPVGKLIDVRKRPNGLEIKKVRVPIGLIAIIYESRPNVTSDCFALTFKSGNAVILRGGQDAIESNIAIYESIREALGNFKEVPEGVISLIKNTSHDAVRELLGYNEYIDLVIPRGGENLIREVSDHSRIPVIKHYKGVCHVYVDDEADLNMAQKISFNAKVARPSVCNAMETLLVHKDIAARFLPGMAEDLRRANVELRGDDKARSIVKDMTAATEEDWSKEYLDLILSIKVVGSLDDAIDHINKYGTKHSDAIVTDNKENADKFLSMVDSACVFVNASTRFTDGEEFGMGCEIGISTDKIHARGPMGLEELTTYKYVIVGNGQIRG